MKQLHTISKTFEAPIGELRSTCRLGKKWMNDLEIGEEIVLTVGESDTDRAYYGKARVVALEYRAFRDITERHIHTNHSTVSRQNINFLTTAMCRAYGSRFQPWESNVTVLFYARFE